MVRKLWLWSEFWPNCLFGQKKVRILDSSQKFWKIGQNAGKNTNFFFEKNKFWQERNLFLGVFYQISPKILRRMEFFLVLFLFFKRFSAICRGGIFSAPTGLIVPPPQGYSENVPPPRPKNPVGNPTGPNFFCEKKSAPAAVFFSSGLVLPLLKW